MTISHSAPHRFTASPERAAWWPALSVAAIAGCGFALALYVFYPGVMTYDALYVYKAIAEDKVGDWQSPCYFAEWQQVIRSDFAFPPPHEAEVTALATAIRGARNPVAVHVRRGDYAHSPRVVAVHAGCATQRYYHQALMALRERRGALDIFVFSDEGDVAGALIAEVLQPLDRVTVASAGGMPWRDLYLMSLARDHIIANSSFSWWGAWLSPENGIVAAPNRWFAADPASGRPNRDHLPDHWIAVGG